LNRVAATLRFFTSRKNPGWQLLMRHVHIEAECNVRCNCTSCRRGRTGLPDCAWPRRSNVRCRLKRCTRFMRYWCDAIISAP